jgi:hypothetical protein
MVTESNIEDPRKTGLKNGLRQLTIEQLKRVINYDGEMVLDEFNYHEGKFCPLAVGLELDKTIKYPTHDKVFGILTDSGYTVYNTRGIPGEYYTDNRKEDLLQAAKEVLAEKYQASCPCLAAKHSCGVCEAGTHIFCNWAPHGDPEEAYDWFIKNPQITVQIKPITPCPEYERAVKEINKKNNANTKQ